MIRISLLATFLLFVSCSKEEKVGEVKKEKVSVAIDRNALFNSSFLGSLYYEKYGEQTVWEDYQDRQDLIDFILEKIEGEGLSISTYKMKELCLAHINYQELDYQQHVQADLDFTHTFLQVVYHLQFGKVNPNKFYSDWESGKKRFIDTELLHEALATHQVFSSLDKKIPVNPFYKDLRNEYQRLNDLESDKAKKIIVNMERSRWMPDDLGQNYVWVNLPEERLRVFEGGIETQVHRVIIGKPDRKTPILSSIINQLVINPTWTVPPTILKNDLVPKASANRGYFASQRLKIVDKATGATVSPENWNPEKFNSYRYVQSTGNLNALGLIKFNFPNKHMVYLHDTNNRSMFNQTNRALSSGCVRVENPFSLAEKILAIEQNDLTRSDLDTLVKREKTKFIELKKIVHVHQTYLTAYVENGQLKMFNDVYDLDNGLYQRLSKLK